MITYDKPPIWRRAWVRLLAGALLVALVAGLVLSGRQGTPAAPAPPTREGLVPQGITPTPPPVALLSPPAVDADGRPADFSPAEWAALKDAMAQSAHPQAELQRVVAYLRFQRGFEQWQAMQDQPDTALRRQLGQRLLEQVPERLRQGESTMGEALMLSTALLADLEPDEAQRQVRLDAARAALEAAAPLPDKEQQAREAALLAEYKRREAAIVADWQARPSTDRSQARLEQALEAARRAVYGGQN